MNETQPIRRIPRFLIVALWLLVAISAFATWKLKTQRDLALEQMKRKQEVVVQAYENQAGDTEISLQAKGSIWPEEGIEDFSLTERSGRTVTKKDLLGKPWVACFVFTRCAGPCPRVSLQFYQLQKDLKDLDFKLVTFTVDPKNDTPEVLTQYAESVGADPEKWLFLTGDQSKIYHLIEKSFLMPVQENTGAARQPGFEVIHTTNVMLVDKDGRVLGKYNAGNDEEMASLRKAVKKEIKKDEKKSETNEPEQESKPKPVTPPKAGMISLSPLFSHHISSMLSSALVAQTDREPPVSEKEPLLEAAAVKQAPAWVLQLPAVNAALNGLATILLMVGYGFIRKGEKEKHKKTMLTAFGTSILFLVFYLLYHFALQSYTGNASRKFEGEGPIRTVYFIILITHVVLAAAVPILAWVTIRRGLKKQWEAHRRIAKITFPIWLYVSITGVVIYFMLYHFNGIA
ncbi:MAG: DUF420 domain-containing protein [Gimesia sp.]|nr:DUF420 domain-containing protein [Gimesia sp.]